MVPEIWEPLCLLSLLCPNLIYYYFPSASSSSPTPAFSCGLAELFGWSSPFCLVPASCVKDLPFSCPVSSLNNLPSSGLYPGCVFTAVFSSCISVLLSCIPSLKLASHVAKPWQRSSQCFWEFHHVRVPVYCSGCVFVTAPVSRNVSLCVCSSSPLTLTSSLCPLQWEFPISLTWKNHRIKVWIIPAITTSSQRMMWPLESGECLQLRMLGREALASLACSGGHKSPAWLRQCPWHWNCGTVVCFYLHPFLRSREELS